MVVLGTMLNKMPELPEVETVKNTLKELTLNKTIESVKVLRKQTIENETKYFEENLRNKTIIGFERIGKFIIFHLTDNLVIVSHLRMEGKFFLKDKKEALTKHDLVIFNFTDNTKLIYNDTRRFGRMFLTNVKDYKNIPPLCNVGPDPFIMKDASRLIEKFQNKKKEIKTSLLDQSIMSGLGNIYVDEVLFETKIHPETPACMLTKEQLTQIWIQSKNILSKAIEAGGSTIKSYHPKEGISGNFQVNLKVYGKKDGICPNCGTKLYKIFVNGRGTTFCPHCQKNPAIPEIIGVTGPIGAGKSTVGKLIEKRGYLRIDADEFVHNLYKNPTAQQDIKKIIPELVIKNNEINRQWLKQYLLDNENKKKRLEKYVHSRFSEYAEGMIRHTKQPIVMEVPFLFETGLDLLCDKTIFVTLSKDKQIEHLKTRKSDVESSLKLNAKFNNLNIKKATNVIINNNDVANLEKQIDSIFCK